MPPVILDTDVPRAAAVGDRQAREVGEHAIAHERADADVAVIGAGHGVSYSGVEPPDGEAVGQRNRPLELGRLTEECHEGSCLTADRRHLIHHAARRADDQVLHLLATDCLHAGGDMQAPRRQHGLHGRGLDGGRRADALALRHVGLDEERRAAVEGEALLSGKHVKYPGDVRRPMPGMVSREPLAGARVRRSAVLEEIERHSGDVRARGVRRLDVQDAIGAPLHGHARGLPDRPLQHQRAGIVGDAAHDVEPPRRAGDKHRLG